MATLWRSTTPFTQRNAPSFVCQSCRQFSIRPKIRQEQNNTKDVMGDIMASMSTKSSRINGIQDISLSSAQDTRSSLSELEDNFKNSPWTRPNKTPKTFGSRYAAGNLVFPESDSPFGNPTTYKAEPRPRVLRELPIHLSARTGRSIDVDPSKNNDLGTRLRQLEMLCTRNRVRADFAKQRFHERPGMKRKRLASSRWRTRFKNEFKKTVHRVQQLRKKGW